MNLSGMTADHSVVQPKPAGNCANWELAHLIQVQNGLLAALGEPPVWTDAGLRNAAVNPIASADDAFDWDAMKAAWNGSRDRTLVALGRQTEEDWNESLPDPFGGSMSRAALVSLIANHQPYRIGQIGLLRRLAGLEGSIKGPGEG